MRREKGTEDSAFSLIELMCVMTIIAILASLMLGPISKAFAKAKRFDWEQKSEALVNRFESQMRQQFGEALDYPALTIDQMFEGRIIDGTLRDFLKDKRVQFMPFSSSTPDAKPILIVTTGKNSSWTVTKADIKPRH
jgi:prepilin-type N-terminal cleavage/methylation domain-containing protein